MRPIFLIRKLNEHLRIFYFVYMSFILKTQVNRYGYQYFHRNFVEYGYLQSEIARKRTVFICNTGHSNTTLFMRPYFHCIRSYMYRNLIMIWPYTDRIIRPG
jgi:hypothetical protein